MDLEYYFRNEIDFRNLKSVANLLSTKFQCINKISFLQGKEDRQYILLFETDSTNSLDFISLSIMMDHGILEYQENRDILIKAKSTHYSLERSFIENWYVFRVDVDGYYLSHPSFEEKYDWEGFDALSIEEKVERINKGIKLIGRFLPPT
ncbi:MAG: hypothetical protein GY729_16120, partial [Desulfobacteraceae bacterium]|nr:hypothetical protein [Desulfobacteraceae bacterium]